LNCNVSVMKTSRTTIFPESKGACDRTGSTLKNKAKNPIRTYCIMA
jgi:hypothetical protein